MLRMTFDFMMIVQFPRDPSRKMALLRLKYRRNDENQSSRVSCGHTETVQIRPGGCEILDLRMGRLTAHEGVGLLCAINCELPVTTWR
jgi:hypothetical protein